MPKKTDIPADTETQETPAVISLSGTHSGTVALLEPKPDPHTIRHLENLLAEAQAGRVVGVLAFAFGRGGAANVWSAGTWARSAAVFAVEVWKHNFLAGLWDAD